MLSVFTDVVVPVFVIAGLGHLIGRWRPLDVATLTTATFFLFGPALVFDSLAGTELTWSLAGRIVGVFAAMWAAMVVLSIVWSRARGHDSVKRAATMLALTSPNTGNMGIPVATLAFGVRGLEIAVVNFVIGAVVTNSAGIAIASTANGGSRRAALTAPLKYPYVYAAVLGLAVRATGVDLPTAVAAPIATLAGAAIPVMLLVLGLQLRNPAAPTDAADVATVVVGRNLLAPAAAFVAATIVGMDGVDRGTMTVLSAMPVAVITTIIATEFRARPDFVTRTVILSTVAAIVTLTVLISLVR
jgi:predicted permease